MTNGLLGVGTNRAFIATRDGESLLMEAPLTSIEWGRDLCSISQAVVTVDPARCTEALSLVHPWAHSLVVYRNDERVWEGPIRRRKDSRSALTITASDVIGWTERRGVVTARNVVNAAVRDQLAWSINQAFAADDPNVLPFLQTVGSATRTTDLQVAVGEKYHASVLSDLTGSGGRWTALGRRIILWDEAASIGSLPDLSPENHLLADVELVEDGDALGTRVIARNDNGVVGYGIHSGGSATDPFYGRVDLLVPSAGTKPAGVTRTAQSAAEKAWPAPITIEVPADAALRCDAPFPISRLVPGVTVPVSTVTATARTVRGTFLLVGMSVKQQAGGDEQVTITLAPPSEALS